MKTTPVVSKREDETLKRNTEVRNDEKPKEQIQEKKELTEKPETKSSDNKKTIRHVVQPGENIYRISKMYGVTVVQICEWNGIKDFVVKAGQTLQIRSENKTESVPSDTTQ